METVSQPAIRSMFADVKLIKGLNTDPRLPHVIFEVKKEFTDLANTCL